MWARWRSTFRQFSKPVQFAPTDLGDAAGREDDEMTRDTLAQILKDACPHCARDLEVERRSETSEWVHRPQGPMSITLCLATHLREKYKDVLNG